MKKQITPIINKAHAVLQLSGLPIRYAATSANPALSAGAMIRAQAYAYPNISTILGQLAAPKLPWIKLI